MDRMARKVAEQTVAVMLISVLALFGGQSANAQRKPEMNVMVEPLDEDGKRCGLAIPNLQSIAALSLKNHGIGVSSERATLKGPALFYLRPQSFHVSGSCVVQIWVQAAVVASKEEAEPIWSSKQFKRKRGEAVLELCEEGMAIVGKPHQIGERLHSSLEGTIKRCLGKVAY